jgi:hypothetical protein
LVATHPKPLPLRPRGAEEHFYVLSDEPGKATTALIR